MVSETDDHFLCWPFITGSPQSIGFGLGRVSLGEASLACVRTVKHLHCTTHMCGLRDSSPRTNPHPYQRDDSHLPAVPLAHEGDSPRKTSGPAHIRERLLAYANGSEPATACRRTHGTSQFRRRSATVYRTGHGSLDAEFRRRV